MVFPSPPPPPQNTPFNRPQEYKGNRIELLQPTSTAPNLSKTYQGFISHGLEWRNGIVEIIYSIFDKIPGLKSKGITF